ncbi:MAG: hypothetical protein MZV70_05150 [Desulfobacterales bacterium]|nr:hypothetical protein [Desulfobacterales bacterium]
MLGRLAALHSGYRVTLNLTDLKVEEVLELLYDCQGMITRLEIFNLKDYSAGKTGPHSRDQPADAGDQRGQRHPPQAGHPRDHQPAQGNRRARNPAQLEKLTAILYDIDTFKSYYSGRPLKARIGSDSTGRSARLHGMGLAIVETLPRRAQREIAQEQRRKRARDHPDPDDGAAEP